MRAVTVACFLAYFVYAWAIHVDFSSEYTMISFGRFLRRLFLLE